MKTSQEMAEHLIERRSQYIQNQRQKKQIRYVLGAVLFIAGSAGMSFWYHQTQTKPETPEPLVHKEEMNPSVLSEAQKDHTPVDSDKLGDMLGMLVVEDTTYMQCFKDPSAYTKKACIGLASDFEGTYQKYTDDLVDGKVYTVEESDEILIIELDNDGTVLLKKR